MIGIDEVGRGCWAGPLLVVAARQKGELPMGLRDSKRLSAEKRSELAALISEMTDVGEGWVEPAEIDDLGLGEAMRLAVARALKAIQAKTHEDVIMDGNVNFCPEVFTNVQTVIKADDSHSIVSAASIYAKHTRDEYMKQQAKKFSEYAFEKHVGYGTALHKQALEKHGPCAIHRLSYKPVRVQYEFHRAR